MRRLGRWFAAAAARAYAFALWLAWRNHDDEDAPGR